ncbi:hypothetical protein HDC37_003162 [Microbacterium sp. AK009]|uniref:hypothetical protein n=1 Tax=Microbacterium sp. AK009 TaxID=2723068 RepID=UPI0015CE7B41|nr:hypothetical protein [Microbacterium sp. AK009]NYF18306.1 hypothetical protein [Microbacterium sp. AK009]
MRYKTAPIAVAAITVTLLLVTGCGSAPTRNHSDARAQLDVDSGQIDLPLEAYAMSEQEITLVSEANALLVARCMDASGREFPRAFQDWESASVFPDRRYGLWVMAEAEANGYEVPPPADAERVSAMEEQFDDDWWESVDRCFADTELLPLMGVNTDPLVTSPVDEGMRESFESLLTAQTFTDARNDWRACVEAEGVSWDPDATVLVPQVPAPGEEHIRVATIDVSCKQNLNTVQRLADFETRQQLAFIDQREAELREYRAAVDEVLAKARSVIAEGGASS